MSDDDQYHEKKWLELHLKCQQFSDACCKRWYAESSITPAGHYCARAGFFVYGCIR